MASKNVDQLSQHLFSKTNCVQRRRKHGAPNESRKKGYTHMTDMFVILRDKMYAACLCSPHLVVLLSRRQTRCAALLRGLNWMSHCHIRHSEIWGGDLWTPKSWHWVFTMWKVLPFKLVKIGSRTSNSQNNWTNSYTSPCKTTSHTGMYHIFECLQIKS